jgi:acyl-CoA dehydrogenase
VDFTGNDSHDAIRDGIRKVCAAFGDPYWREVDRTHSYPTEFVQALIDGGWLAVLIPEEYGGGGQGMQEAIIVLEEINASGGNAAPAHAQMYTMGTVLRHGNDDQKQRFLPKIASGELRLQAFGITEPDAGSDTTKISTFARRDGDRYLVNGQKIWISRTEYSDLMLLLARTTPVDQVERKTKGLSTFLVDLRQAVADGQIEIRRIETMVNHHTTELFITDLEIPVENRIGEEGEGFRYILDGMNAERILVTSEGIGDGRWFVKRAAEYASERVVFGRPIGSNQGVQFPIAQAHAQIEAAALLRDKAAWLFDNGLPCGTEANMAKLLASQAAWQAANACLDAHGGYGLAVEYDVERKWRETRGMSIAPVNNNLILAHIAQHALGMPRSY